VYGQQLPTPAHISTVEGEATLDRETGIEAAVTGMPFVPGDRITTEAGRVEILFTDGSALAVDEYTSVDMQSETLMRLVAGRVLLNVTGTADPSRARRYQIDTPVATVANAGPGEFRVTLINGRTELEAELAVLRGSASLTTELGSMTVRAGERSLAADRIAPSFPEIFNSARLDDFDRWAQARRSARLGPALSAQYLPSDLRMYSTTLDRYGDWSYEPSYGYVWYPTVAAGWQPYYNGYWGSVPRYGWTWIGHDFWGWPTHHYGRWGFGRSRWFWIPDRHWGTGWVSWASAPGFVSWGPLGFNNRPVFALNFSFGNPWLGWAVLPHSHFGVHATYVNHYVSARRLPPARNFVVHQNAPIRLPRAVPRNPAQSANSVAVVPGAGPAANARPGLADVSRRGNAAVPISPNNTPAFRASGSRAVNRPDSAAPPVFKQPLIDPDDSSRRLTRPANASRQPGVEAATEAPVANAPGNNSRPRNFTSPWTDGRPANAPASSSRRTEPLARQAVPPPADPVNNVNTVNGVVDLTRRPDAAPRGNNYRAAPRSAPAAAPPDAAPPSSRSRPSSPPPSAPSSGERRAGPRNAPAQQSAPPPSASPSPRAQGQSGNNNNGGGGGAPAGARNSGRSR
jgi:hypothetical protein